MESSGVKGDGGFEEEEVCCNSMAFDMMFVFGGYGGGRGVILEEEEEEEEEEKVSEREGFGLSTKAGMSLQRVEGVKKGVVVLVEGCAHRRRRWQSWKRGDRRTCEEGCQQGNFVLYYDSLAWFPLDSVIWQVTTSGQISTYPTSTKDNKDIRFQLNPISAHTFLKGNTIYHTPQLGALLPTDPPQKTHPGISERTTHVHTPNCSCNGAIWLFYPQQVIRHPYLLLTITAQNILSVSETRVAKDATLPGPRSVRNCVNISPLHIFELEPWQLFRSCTVSTVCHEPN